MSSSRKKRRLNDATVSTRESIAEALRNEGFHYSTVLRAHTSCVNALAISRAEGRYLASGGDDLCIRLWDLTQDLNSVKPCATFLGPRGNIFDLSWSSDNSYLLASGVDGRVYKYDLETGSSSAIKIDNGLPTEELCMWEGDALAGPATIRSVKCHSEEPGTFMVCSEDRTLAFYDSRSSPSKKTGCLYSRVGLTHAQFSPTQSNIFAVSNTLGEIHLHDRRKAPLFSSMSEQAMDASRSAAVVRYVTGLSPRRFPRTIHRPEATSLAFSPDGALLAAQVSQSWPTLFAVGDPQPLAVLSAEGFSDNSTIKHGSFHGSADNVYYATGSDNRAAYTWKLPTIQNMREERNTIAYDAATMRHELHDIGFASNAYSDRTFPLHITIPNQKLQGYRSIVNTALYHPHLPLLFTCGVEKGVKVWSATAFSETPSEEESLPPDQKEDARVMGLFDLLLERDEGTSFWKASNAPAREEGSSSD